MALDFLRDVFDANTKEDQKKRLKKGGKRYYKEDELAKGNKRPKENFAAQAVPSALRFLNTVKAGAGTVKGGFDITRESLLGSDESYQNKLNEVVATQKRDLGPTGGAFGVGTFFDDAEQAGNINPGDMAKKIVGGGVGTYGDIGAPGLGKLVKGASLGKKVIFGLKEGAVGGAAASVGQQLIENGNVNAKQVAIDTASGAAMGGAVPIGVAGAKKGLKATREGADAVARTYRDTAPAFSPDEKLSPEAGFIEADPGKSETVRAVKTAAKLVKGDIPEAPQTHKVDLSPATYKELKGYSSDNYPDLENTTQLTPTEKSLYKKLQSSNKLDLTIDETKSLRADLDTALSLMSDDDVPEVFNAKGASAVRKSMANKIKQLDDIIEKNPTSIEASKAVSGADTVIFNGRPHTVDGSVKMGGDTKYRLVDEDGKEIWTNKAGLDGARKVTPAEVEAPQSTPVKTGKVEIPDKYAQEYADMLMDQEDGLKGGQLVPDGEAYGYGKKRTTEHSKFYSDFYKENKRKPGKKDWLEYAREEAKTNKDFMDYVNSQTDPERLSLEQEAESGALGIDNQEIGGTFPVAGSEKKNFLSFMGEQPDVNSVPRSQTRESGFVKSVREGENWSPEVKDVVAGVEPSRYVQKAQQPIVDRARDMVENNYDEAVARVNDLAGTENHDEAVILAGQVLSRMAREGRNADAAKLAGDISLKGTEMGRGVKAFDTIKRLTPEGMLVFAQREIGKIEDTKGFISKAIGKAKGEEPGGLTPDAVGDITDRMKVVENLDGGIAGDEAKAVKEALDGPLEFADGEVDDIMDKAIAKMEGEEEGATVGQKVAKNVGNAVDPKKKKVKIDELVNELSSKIKKDILGLQPKKTVKNYTEIIKGVLGRNSEALEAFPEVKDILRERFADNPEALQVLEKLFKQAELDFPVSKGTINKAVAEQLKAHKVEIKKVIYESLSNQKAARDKIQKALIVRGVDEKVAIEYAATIIDDVNSRLFGAKKKALERLMADAPPRAKQTIIDKINKLSNLGALDDMDYLELARKKLNLPDLDPETAARLSKYSQEIQDNPELSSQLIGEVMDIINEQVPIGFSEKFDSYRYQNLLSNPRTQARNTMSNLFNTTITKPVTLAVKGANDFFANGLTGKERQHYMKEVPEYYKGMFNSIAGAVDEMKKVWSGEVEITNPDTSALKARRQKMIPGKYTVIPRLMEAQDAFFSKLIGSGEFAAQKAKGASDEVAQKAAQEASQYSLFRGAVDPKNESGQGALLSKIDKVTDSVMKFGSKHKTFRWFVPFVRTPLNVTKQFIEFSPAGLATLPGSTRKADQLAKTMIGTSVALIGAKLALDGMTTWDAPKDEKQRELFYASGRRPYSVKVGDRWVPMIYFGPLAYSLGLPAAIKDANDDAPLTASQTEKLVGALSNQAKFFSQQTYVQGISNMMDVISGDGNASLMASLGFTAGQAIPLQGLNRYVNSIVDPIFRKKSSFVEGLATDLPVVGGVYSKGLEGYDDPITGELARRNQTDYTLPYTMGIPGGSEGQKGYVTAATDFYKNLRKISPERTKYNDKINEAIEAGDLSKAQQLTREYNDMLKNQFKGWSKKHGSYKNEQTLAEAYNKNKIKLTRTSIAQRRYSIQKRAKQGVFPG